MCFAHAGHTQRFGKMAGLVYNLSFCLLINFCAVRKFTVSNPLLRQALGTLSVMAFERSDTKSTD